MINNGTALEVQFEAKELEIGITSIGNTMSKLMSIANQVGQAFERVFSTNISNNVDNAMNSLDVVVTKMTELIELLKPQDESWFDSVVDGIDAFNTIADGRVNLEGISDAISSGLQKAAENGEGFNILKALIPDTLDMAGEISSNLLPSLNEYISAVRTAAPEVGTFAAMFPQLSSAFSSAGTAISNGINGFTSMFSGATVGWGALIAAIIAVVVAAVILIIDNWDAIVSALGVAADWLNTHVVQPIVGFVKNLADSVNQTFTDLWVTVQRVVSFVQSLFAKLGDYLKNAFAKDWTEQFGAFGNILNAFFANVENVWNAVKMIFSGIVTFVKNIFAGDWKGAWDGIVQIFLGIWEGMQAAIKWPINGIIGVINGLVSAVVSGINGAIKALNKLKFTVPDWVPVIGGKYFGFNIGLLTAPQIPYLAKGAVLPANKPFLAMVGDQKHGTNIEAPLATIQDAVALVMNDQAAAMMAGFEAVVRAINEKNATLELDGREIWAAYNAYNRKAAVVRGHVGFRKLWSKRQEQGFLKLIAKNGRPVISSIPMKGGDSHADVTRRRGKRLRFLVSALIMVPKGAW